MGTLNSEMSLVEARIMSPELSVIIPIYNVEHYLEECVSSVLNQETDMRYEVILVDDGSTDGSSALCDRFSAEHSHVRVIHQENAGLSCARNAGMDTAEGEYIVFLDGDDCWLPGAMESFREIMSRAADMGLFAAERFQDNHTFSVIRSPILPSGESGKQFMDSLFASGNAILPYAWLYLYRREFLRQNQFRFQAGQASSEDFEFNMNCICILSTLLVLPLALQLFLLNTTRGLRRMNKDEALDFYHAWSLIRLLLISLCIAYNLIAYFMTLNATGLLCALMGLCITIYCLPTHRRIREFMDIVENDLVINNN